LNLKSRLKTLERQQRHVLKGSIRLVVSRVAPLDLSKATCSRTIMPDGRLTELVDLHGGDYGLSQEDLEGFIQSFPVERCT
jgi:hypothetical protein